MREFKLTKDQLERFKQKGKYFGYPDCCIEAFPNESNRDETIHQYKGFLPCETCATKIRLGLITIEQLITNRQHPDKYPKDEYN